MVRAGFGGVGSTAVGPDTARYCDVRTATETLAAPLSAEDQTVQSMPDVSPAKWHRAHVTWFFETFILGPSGRDPYRAEFAYLFNSYYEAVGPRHPRPQRGLLTRPSAAEVGEYRQAVDRSMLELLAAGVDDEVGALVELGLNHEQQHQELLLMDIKHVLSCNPMRPAYTEAGPHPTASALPGGLVSHGGGEVEIGHDGAGFAFDNESPRHRVLLAPFAVSSTLVTNAEWLAFIDDGGYRRPELWLSDGWATVCGERWEAPLYWEHDGDGGDWAQFTLSGMRPVQPGEPVCHVSYYEADAYARWAGGRLPLEAEWEVLASQGALADAYDQVWQWTASAYLPYPGFRTAAGAVGEYNGKFMVNQHVLRGSCCLTPAGHTRPTYRNFFPPSARWACSGVRLAVDAG
ncbi:MAG: ergothioneine biosynthesis protein EgtB [Acidobacteria bacterium]|nr:ergothioneine biosynthesis protein EgtB [Acidobacteriota bacterium]